MSAQINKKITSYKVVTPETQQVFTTEPEKPLPDFLHEGVERPEILFGSTYKFKTPQSESAIYVTINDIILNVDTEFEDRRPFEIFLNTKDMQHYQWVVGMTRLISSNFRKGGNLTYIVDELKAVFDPSGGWWDKGTYIPSVVAKIGYIIEVHLKAIGKISTEPMPEYQKEFIAAKRAEFEALNEVVSEGDNFPEKATLCHACLKKAVVILDGCACCLACGASKCE